MGLADPWRDPEIRRRVMELLGVLYQRTQRGLIRMVERVGGDTNELPSNTSALADFLEPTLGQLSRRRITASALRDTLLRDGLEGRRPDIDAVLLPAMLWEACQADGIAQTSAELYARGEGLFEHARTLPGRAAVEAWIQDIAPGCTSTTRLPPVLWMSLASIEGEPEQFQLTGAWGLRLGRNRHTLFCGSEEHDLGSLAHKAHALGLTWKQARSEGGEPREVALVVEVDAERAALPFQAASNGLRKLHQVFLAVAVCPRRDGVRLVGPSHDDAFPPPTKRGPCRKWLALPTSAEEQQGASIGVWATNDIWGVEACCPILHGHTERTFAVLAKAPRHLDATIRKVHPKGQSARLHALMKGLGEHTHLLWADARLCPPTP